MNFTTMSHDPTDLVQVENQSQLRSWRHPMDQYRQFLSLFNRTGQATLLDVHNTTGGAKSFNFTYVLEKKFSDSQWALSRLEPT
jgi:hypothetical protein